MSSVAILSTKCSALIARFGAHEHDDEVTLARDAYSLKRGRIFEDDEQWESFSSAFLEWYVTERKWRDTGLSPAQIAAKEATELSDAAALLALARGQRALVKIEKLGKNSIQLVDLIGGAWFSVIEERSLVGMNVGDVVELRLFGFMGEVSLGRTFLYHPPSVLSAITERISIMKSEGSSRSEIIDHLAGLRLRSRSYKHVSPIRMYESNGQLATRE